MKAQDNLSSLAFFLELCGEIYQFSYNLPFVVYALLSCQQNYKIVPAPHVSCHLFSCLNGILRVFLLPFAVIDLLAESVVDIAEFAYSTTLYHGVYTGAAIGCLVMGDYDKLGEVREWMDQCYMKNDKGVDVATQIVEEIIDDVVASEVAELPLDDGEEEVQDTKMNKSIIQKENESGYLTEADVEE